MVDAGSIIVFILALGAFWVVWVWAIPKAIAAVKKRVFYSSEAAEMKLFVDEKLCFETTATAEQIAESLRAHITTDSKVAIIGLNVVPEYVDGGVLFTCKSPLQFFFQAQVVWNDVDGRRAAEWDVVRWQEVDGAFRALGALRRLRSEVITSLTALPGPDGQPQATATAGIGGAAHVPLTENDALSAEAAARRDKLRQPYNVAAGVVMVVGVLLVWLRALGPGSGLVVFGIAAGLFFLGDRAGRVALTRPAPSPMTAPPVAPPAPLIPSAPPVPQAPRSAAPTPTMPARMPVASVPYPPPPPEYNPVDPAWPAVEPTAAPARSISPKLLIAAGVGLAAIVLTGVALSGIAGRAPADPAPQDTAEVAVPAAAPAEQPVPDSSSSAAGADGASALDNLMERVTFDGSGHASLFDLPAADAGYKSVQLIGVSTDPSSAQPEIRAKSASADAETYAMRLSDDWEYYIDGAVTNSSYFSAMFINNHDLPITVTLNDQGIVNMNVSSSEAKAPQMTPGASHLGRLEDLLAIAPADGSERTFQVVVGQYGSGDTGGDRELAVTLVDGGETLSFAIPLSDLGPTTVDGSDVNQDTFYSAATSEGKHIGTLTITTSRIGEFDVESSLMGGDI